MVTFDRLRTVNQVLNCSAVISAGPSLHDPS